MSGKAITCKLIRANILFQLAIPKITARSNQFFQLCFAHFQQVYNFVRKFF